MCAWIAALASLEGENPGRARWPEVVRTLKEIRDEMERTGPRRNEVAEGARKVLALLDAELKHTPREPCDKLARRVSNSLAVNTWDEAAQGYLALAALDRRRPVPTLPPMRSLRALPGPQRFPLASLRHAWPIRMSFVGYWTRRSKSSLNSHVRTKLLRGEPCTQPMASPFLARSASYSCILI